MTQATAVPPKGVWGYGGGKLPNLAAREPQLGKLRHSKGSSCSGLQRSGPVLSWPPPRYPGVSRGSPLDLAHDWHALFHLALSQTATAVHGAGRAVIGGSGCRARSQWLLHSAAVPQSSLEGIEFRDDHGSDGVGRPIAVSPLPDSHFVPTPGIV